MKIGKSEVKLRRHKAGGISEPKRGLFGPFIVCPLVSYVSPDDVADVTISPVALTKYPLLQSAPPHMPLSSLDVLSSDASRTRSSRSSLIPPGYISGSAHKEMDMVSASPLVPRSRTRIAPPFQRKFPSVACATGSFNTILRYFGTQTKWYFSSYTAWLVRPYSTPNTLSLYPSRPLEDGSSAPARGAVSARGMGK